VKNAVTCTFNEAVGMIRIMPINDSILLCGDHGLGKSAAVFAAGQSFIDDGIEDFYVNDVRLAGKEPGDIIGLLEFYDDPVLDENGEQTFDHAGQPMSNKLSRHCPPAWWAPYFNVNHKGILFLDEINRAHRDVRQGLFQLILDRELNGYKLPHGVKIVGAINDSEDYDTESLDPAFRSRWRCINFSPTTDEWLELDMHPLVSEFISSSRNCLESFKKEVDIVTPDRRSWHHLSEALKEHEDKGLELDDKDFKIFSGTFIGLEVATAFMDFRKNKTIITGKKVLNSFEQYKKFINFKDVGLLSKIGTEIVEIIKTDKKMSSKSDSKQVKNLIKFIIRIPLENARVLYDSSSRANAKMLRIFMEHQKSNPEFAKKISKTIGKIKTTDE